MTGASGVTASVIRTAQDTLGGVGSSITVEARCPSLGSALLGGSYSTGVTAFQSADVVVNSAIPIASNGTFTAAYQVKFTRMNGSAAVLVLAYAICTP